MANCITIGRLLLLFVVVAICYSGSARLQLINAPLLAAVFLMDGLDGYIARRRGEASLFGAVLDISVDRVVENVLWLVLVDLGLAPVWVAIVFLTRSFAVDGVRSHGVARGETPFGMMRSKIGRFIVASRFMRLGYGILKGVTFGYVLTIQPWPALFPEAYGRWHPLLDSVRMGLIYATVSICLVRGIPVLLEVAERRSRRSALRAPGKAAPSPPDGSPARHPLKG